jgi:organic radical activating enzyme
LDEAWGRADELKVIVEGEDDIAWAEECARRVEPSTRLFLQPEWSRRDSVVPLLVDYIKEHPRWRVSLQAHKYMRIP